ncbi:MAG: hypothetical protein JXA77_07310 [Bacteroidales bacterium]|nr:hypothetical protein [Bacteroidales bacterium]MBN2819684.1 hypothetical protein [Bacteroidales bacterium]
MKVFRAFVFISFIVFVLPEIKAQQKEVFIKQINFELSVISDIDYENEYFVTMKFNKGSKYIFKIVNKINDKPGLALLEILDADTRVLTNMLGDKYFENIVFQCNKTGFYDVLLTFRDEQVGHCQIDILMVQ